MTQPFKCMSDAYGQLGLYKRIASKGFGAMQGWELIAEEREFPALRSALTQAEVPELPIETREFAT